MAGRHWQSRSEAAPRGLPRGLELRFASQPRYLSAVRHAIEAYSASHGFDEKSIAEIGLCLNEALANVIRHAYGNAADGVILVQAECDERQLRLTVRDWGCGRNPEELPAREYDPLTPGGLGLICLRQLLDRVSYQPQADGMLLVMEKQKAAVADVADSSARRD